MLERAIDPVQRARHRTGCRSPPDAAGAVGKGARQTITCRLQALLQLTKPWRLSVGPTQWTAQDCNDSAHLSRDLAVWDSGQLHPS